MHNALIKMSCVIITSSIWRKLEKRLGLNIKFIFDPKEKGQDETGIRNQKSEAGS